MMNALPKLCLAFLLVALIGCGAPGPGIDVSDARVRALLPGQDKTVGYLRIRNTTAASFTLVAAASPSVRTIEFHTTVRDGDIMRMRRLSEVEVPAGGDVSFEPGGRHLMLFGAGDLGEDVSIVLTGADGQTIEVVFDVVDPTAA